jgi:hypothetical protein
MAVSTLYADAYYGVKPDGLRAGVCYCRTGDYVVGNSALDANSTISLLKVPSGARISRIDYKVSALGAGRTIDIGNASDEDKYLPAANAENAMSGSIVPDNEVLSADETIVVKIEGDTCPAAAEFVAHVYYHMADGVIADEAAVAS